MEISVGLLFGAIYLLVGFFVLSWVDRRWWGSVEALVGSSLGSAVFGWILWPFAALLSWMHYRNRHRHRSQARGRSAGDVKNPNPISLQGYKRRHD